MNDSQTNATAAVAHVLSPTDQRGFFGIAVGDAALIKDLGVTGIVLGIVIGAIVSYEIRYLSDGASTVGFFSACDIETSLNVIMQKILKSNYEIKS